MKKSLPFVFFCATIFNLAYGQTYQMKMAATNNFVVVQLSQSEFNGWNSTMDPQNNIYPYNTQTAHTTPITKQVYSQFCLKDEYDFIVFVLDQTQAQHQAGPASDLYGMNVTVSNDVQGIGANIFSNSAQYGSASRLKSHLTLWANNYMENGPFLHEFCHNWANYAIPTEDVMAACTDNSGDGCGASAGKNAGGHWGFSGCGGQLGGFDQTMLKTNVDGNPNKYQAGINGSNDFGGNANGGNSVPYSKFELYLMGIIPLNQVPSFDVFTGLRVASSDITGGWNGKWSATGKTTYDNAKISTMLGTRIPSSATSQKEFKALVILLTTSNINAIPAQNLNAVNDQLTRMGVKGNNGNQFYNFWEATGGLASMTFNLTDCTTSLVNISASNFTIYPNPTTDGQINVVLGNELTSNNNLVDISIYDSFGKLVKAPKQFSNQELITLNVSDLNTGVYYVQVKSCENISSINKFIVE